MMVFWKIRKGSDRNKFTPAMPTMNMTPPPAGPRTEQWA